MTIHAANRNSRQLKLTSLDERITPAITFTNVAGHLTIIGDDNNNTIDVAVSSDKKFIVRFGSINIPALNTGVLVKSTTQITVRGNGGNDNISIVSLGSLSIANAISVQGGAGNDTLIGSSKGDNLDGGDNNDSLFGGAGNDTVFGNTGNDTLTGSLGNDFISGGDNVDTVLEIGNVNFSISDAFGGPSLSAGTLGTDSIFSLEIARLIGGTGNNFINANSFIGSVFLDGGAGNDTLIGAFGNDTMVGGTGNDSLEGNTGDDSLTGASGNDTLRGEAGDDLLVGGFGVDVIDGGDDDDRLSEAFGSSAVKTLTLTDTTFRHKESTLDVTDSLVSIEFATIDVQTGSSKISAASFDGSATLLGGPGNDTLLGGSGDDLLDGRGGNDRVELSTMLNATLTDTSLTDFFSTDQLNSIESALIRATAGLVGPNLFDATAFSFNVELRGEFGDDILRGGSGNDVLNGGSGKDQLEGNDGNDTLDGGGSADTILGGNGNDTNTFDPGDNTNLGAGEGGVTFHGTDGDDVMVIKRQVTASGPEAIVEINGQPLIMGYAQGETVSVFGGKGNDVIAMDSSADIVWKGIFSGEDGNDTLVGRSKNDYLDGGKGNDTLLGGDGDDTLIGGAGRDSIDGEAGVDVLVSFDSLWIDSVLADDDDIWHRDSIDRRHVI